MGFVSMIQQAYRILYYSITFNLNMPSPQDNEAALEHLLGQPISIAMISHVAHKIRSVIGVDESPTNPLWPSLEIFIQWLVHRAKMTTSILLSSLIFFSRLRQNLKTGSVVPPRILYAICLTGLIITSKYLRDHTWRNKVWVDMADVRGCDSLGLSLRHINRMEREFLRAIQWDLRITPQHLYAYLEPFASLPKNP